MHNSLWDSRPAAILLALFVVFLWATSWVLIKIGLEDIPPLTFAGLRYTLATLVLLPFFLFKNGGLSLNGLTRRAAGKLMALGLLLYGVTQGAQFLALSYLPAVTVNLLWSFSPVWVALLGLRFLDERTTRFQWLGIFIALAGAGIYFTPAAFPAGFGFGFTAAMIGILSNAIAAVIGREINRARDRSPLQVTVISMGTGSIVLLAVGIAVQGLPEIDLKGWAIISWLAVVNTAFAFTLWNFTLRSLTATESSVINGMMLVFIPVLAVLFLDERIGAKELAGLIAAGLGTLLVQVRRKQQ
ncbi:MAG TPA: DMT family transporter [Anaerolineales bacterium]|nr:DMT family transporter [Anaerolineales bacterium]